ncbi:hypothetical protein IE53DRAFT_390286 [Violaceomyces palustris]|uniref:Uncharacterized protein n=1 Tax=Violaceomyces palustris TaxID=1673888 RepID=A0ACD0NP50_9BASI|nr:hypothetical protein IE53DRAFT_390286 [Violaceomyces palustris]
MATVRRRRRGWNPEGGKEAQDEGRARARQRNDTATAKSGIVVHGRVTSSYPDGKHQVAW